MTGNETGHFGTARNSQDTFERIFFDAIIYPKCTSGCTAKQHSNHCTATKVRV